MGNTNETFDRMIFSEQKYPAEIRLGEDGFYRWQYKLDDYHDRKEYLFMAKFWLIFACAGIVPGILIGRSGARAVLYGLAGFGIFLAAGILITLFVRMMDGGPSLRWYKMNDEYVQIQPSGRGSGISHFSIVRKIFIDPPHNEIRLATKYGNAYLFARAEDFELLENHVLKNSPGSAEIIRADQAEN